MSGTAGRFLAGAALRSGCRVAVAESLTGGALASCLAAAPDASEWFRGGVVAYAADVKHDVLGVPAVPVVSERAALAMAAGVAELLDADVAVAVTGVGGPEPADGVEPGTVWIALHGWGGSSARCFRFEGEPDDVLRQTCDVAVQWLADEVGAEAKADSRAHADDLRPRFGT